MRISTFIVRMAASMLGLFGILGGSLAAVGLYGVIAFNAAQRTRDADPVSFAGTAALLGAVAAVACLLPARCAAGLNPLTALRRE